MASFLNRLWSGLDFYDKEENQKQRQQFAQTRAQQQPRPVVQTKSAPKPQRRIDDNTPGFQWSNNSLTRGLSRAVDQVNPLDSGRSWKTRTPSQEQSQQSGLSQAGKIVAPATGRFLNTAALGGEQVLNTGRMYAAQMSKNPLAFRNANQAALDDYKRYTKEGSGVFGAGSFFKTPEEASSGNLKTVAKRIGGGTLESATEVGSLGLGGFVGKNILQQGIRQGIASQAPTLAKNAVVNAVQGGASAYNQDAGTGDIVKSAAIGAGFGTAADVGLGVGGAVVAQATKPVIKTTTRLASQTLDKIAPVQTTTRLVKRTNRLNLDTTDALKAYSDMLVDADPYIQGKVRSDLIANVRDIGDQLGVDLTNGSVVDQMERIEAILNGYLPTNETGRKLALTPLGEGGYAKNPFYRGDDITAGLSEQQAEFINDYANMLEGMGAGNGVDITPDGRRISNNFRDADTAGRTMTKQDWFEKARKDIESGKAGFGASDDYKKLPGVKSDPLESLKQEARKYKSAEEFVKAKTNQYHGTLDKEFKLDPNSRLFLTGDTDSASTYAGRRYNQEPEGKVVGYHAKDGKTLDLNDNATREEYVRDVLGQNKQLKKYYDQIPESARNDYFDTLGWVMEEHKAGRIPKADLDKYTEAQKNYKGISSKDVYANWDKIIARAKKDGYDYIKHTTEDPSAEITFPETVALNPSKTILDKQQLTDLYNQATQSQPPRPTATTKVENATKEQKVDFANYVLTNIRKHEQINSVGSVLTSLRNKDYPYHKEIMQMWKKWSRYNVGKPAAEAPVNKLPQQMTREEIAKTGVMRVGDADLPTYKTGEVIGDAKPLKKGNVRPDAMRTQSGYIVQYEQYKQGLKRANHIEKRWNEQTKEAAINEARHRNDSMNLAIFEHSDNYGDMERYLFGEEINGHDLKLTYTGKTREFGAAQPSQPPKSTPVQKVEPKDLKKQVADANAKMGKAKTIGELQQAQMEADNLQRKIARMEGRTDKNGNLIDDTPATDVDAYFNPGKTKPTPQPTKGANTPQRQVVNNKAPVEPAQGRTPNQSQSVDIETPQRVERPVSSPEQKTTKAQQKTPPREINQVRPDRTSSSDDIIDLDKVDVNDPFGNSSPVKKLRNEFGRMFIDEDSEMINLLKRVEKETDGQDLVERWLQDSDMVRNSNSIANSKIRTNQNLRDAVQGLRKKEVAEFDAYAAARSELANVKRGLETTSRSVDELQNIVNKHGQKYSQRFESLNRYYNDLANDLYDAGIIDKAKRDTWAKNKDYVRVQRDMEDLLNPGYGASKSRSFGSTSTAKKRTGSKREILSSTQTALKRTQELQLEMQRNKAASNTIDLLSKHGLATRISSQQATGKNVIKRFKDGKVEYFVTHKDIKRVMDNVNPFQLGIIAKVVSAPTRVFRAGTTALSAPFAVTNYLRDQASSAIYSKSVMRTHNPVAIVSGLYQGVKDFGGGRNSKLWERFQRYAGDQTMFDETRNAKNSKAMLNQLRRGGGKYARAVELINPVNTVRNLEDLISITEKSTRYQNFRGIYKKTLKETGNEDIAIQKATQAALQNSVNFSRAGSVTRIVNLMFPYFNAGIQGSRNVGRSLRDRPIQTVTKSAAFVAAPTIGAVLYNYSSEESKRIYENLPENEKENNIVFVLPGAKQREDGTYEGIIKIPKPQGYRELTDPLRVVAEKFAGDTDTKSIGEMAKDMTAAFTGPVQTEDMNKFMSTFVPQTIKPILQAHLNRDLYWGSETVPDYMMEGTDDPTKRAYKGTSGMARWVANQLGVEPIKVEKFIVDSTGSLGRYGINAVDNVLAAQGKIPKEQIGGRSIVDDFSRRMFEARGIEKEEKNMTDGQKYFKAVKEATIGLSPQQKVAWDSYNQSNKNFLGEELYDKSSFAKKQAKAAAYAQFPGLFEVDKKVDAQARQRGEPGNPLYDLNFNQAFKVVQQKAMLPGAKDPELDNLYDHQWYEDFKKKESDYYDKVFADKKDEDLDNPYPKRSEQLTAAMNHYYDLDTSQRRAWRNANPGLYDQFKQYYAAKDAWEDRERIKIGLGPISQHKNSFYGKSGSGGGQGRSGGRKSRLAFEPFKYVKKSSHLNKELRALVEAAGAPSKAFPKAKKTPNYS